MKKFILYLLSVFFVVTLLLCILVTVIVFSQPGRFDKTYQSVLQRKFDTFMAIDEPKIIIIGGSNTGFGINEELLEKETGYPVANLGLHAGFGASIPTSLSKANIQQGDIVLLAYEHRWITVPDYFDEVGTELVMSALDNRIDMYRYIPVKHFPKFLGYLFDYLEKKRQPSVGDTVYGSASFDENGRMILDRPNPVFAYTDENKAIYGEIDISGIYISEETASYLKKYKRFVEEKGASVYFVAVPYYDSACSSSPEDFAKMIEIEETQIGIEYISDPVEYAFPRAYMFDTIYHCNNLGELRRTELLIEDLKRAGII